jgi:transcriptional regulator with XRE-family HTH domain
VRVSIERIRAVCREKGKTLSGLLDSAGVSRNAFYTLARRRSVYPRSLEAVGRILGVPPHELLTAEGHAREEMKLLLAEVDAIARRHRGVDRENVRHTLLLMRKEPIDRLRKALARAQ